jgi:hypothetical protein
MKHEDILRNVLASMEEYASQLTPSLPLTDEEIERKAEEVLQREEFKMISGALAKRAMVEFYKSALSTTSPLTVKRYIHINGMVNELLPENNLQEPFIFEWNGHYQLEISNIDGVLKVTNGVDGYGNNCRLEFENTEVEILYKSAPPAIK